MSEDASGAAKRGGGREIEGEGGFCLGVCGVCEKRERLERAGWRDGVGREEIVSQLQHLSSLHQG